MTEEALDRIREKVIEFLRLDQDDQAIQATGYLLVIADILGIME